MPQAVLYSADLNPEELKGTRFHAYDSYVISGRKFRNPDNWKYIGKGQ